MTRAPYRADPTGRTDSTAAIQRAINDARDARLVCFLPPGRYLVSDTIQGVIGVVNWDDWPYDGPADPWVAEASFNYPCVLMGSPGNGRATIVLKDHAPGFDDPDHPKPVLYFWARSMQSFGRRDPNQPQPLIETVDDADAETMLAMLKLELPVRNPCVYALRWRAGRQSVVRNIYPIRTFWHPHATSYDVPMIRIEGSGGGRWYTQTLLGWWSQGPGYRHLLVKGTREPLRFYHLQPQHARCEAVVELRDAQNVDNFSMKAEGDYTVLWLRHCRNIRLFGYGGNAAPWPGRAIFRVDDGVNLRLANVYPQLHVGDAPGALGIPFHPATWFLLTDGSTRIRGTQQFVLYERR